MSSKPKDDVSSSDYPALDTPIPPHVRARLQAVAAVSGRTVAELLDQWLEREMDGLDDARREVADRLASAALAARKH